ncbi:MAG: hypothetical protein ABIE55_00005 [Candidatus Aenigmatarchaeota archaeon]
MYNHRTQSLVRRAIVEARIRRWFNKGRKVEPTPSILLTKIIKPKKGLQINLTREERIKFVNLIKRMYITRKIILKYRNVYGRRPKLFYKKVFGFPTRKSQSMNIIWNTSHIHFIFERNDLIAFWKKIRWGPGSGGYYSVGDRSIKIKDLRGLISFGRREYYSIETRDIVRHESVHSFEDFVKGRKPPIEKKRFLFYRIKCELNAYLKNFKESNKGRKRNVNESARLGLSVEVKEEVEEYLSYKETIKRISNIKTEMRRTKIKKEKMELRKKLNRLKDILDSKKRKRKIYLNLYRKTVREVKKALEIMPTDVLQRIIYETPFERLQKKIPETVRVYKRMKYEWYYYD